MKKVVLFLILTIPVNSLAADLLTEVKKQISYSWPANVELLANGQVLQISLLEVGLNELTYTAVIRYGVCLLESLHPNILVDVKRITVIGKFRKHYTFNGGSQECREASNHGLESDKYILSKTTQ